ncbi:MAG: MaoC family dehydratase [Neomegalonema sp.]
MSRTIFIEDLTVGMERTRARTVSREDIEAFGRISGDLNPIHFCEDYAASTPFGGVIAHGILTAGLISAVIGEELPGHGSVDLGQSLKFRAPVRPGDTVLARCRVSEIILDKRRLTIDCACLVGDSIVLEGEARVLAPSRAELVSAAA